MAGFYANFEFPKQVLLTRFELDPRKASASALDGKAQVTSDESGHNGADTADAESGLERQESGVKTMEQSSSPRQAELDADSVMSAQHAL